MSEDFKDFIVYASIMVGIACMCILPLVPSIYRKYNPTVETYDMTVVDVDYNTVVMQVQVDGEERLWFKGDDMVWENATYTVTTHNGKLYEAIKH